MQARPDARTTGFVPERFLCGRVRLCSTSQFIAHRSPLEGEAPAEPSPRSGFRFGWSIALHGARKKPGTLCICIRCVGPDACRRANRPRGETVRRRAATLRRSCLGSSSPRVSLCIIARRGHGNPIQSTGSPPRRTEIGGRPPPLPSEPDAGHAAVGIAGPAAAAGRRQHSGDMVRFSSLLLPCPTLLFLPPTSTGRTAPPRRRQPAPAVSTSPVRGRTCRCHARNRPPAHPRLRRPPHRQ